MAQSAATLWGLSGGRLILGLGVSHGIVLWLCTLFYIRDTVIPR